MAVLSSALFEDPPIESAHAGTVAVLNSDLASKIAAGECVERPGSVVKELVENSLDAGATRITVEMEDGGRALIRIIDNGHGIDREDMVLAVQRHATSKLKDLDDLAHICTLGFRGEALPSIAAVSRLDIISAVVNGTPSQLIMEGSEIEDLRAVGAPVGTTVTVRDLFFNTPARLKFLRSAQTEFGHALEHLTRLAISHHSVAFRVIHNGREALNTPGSPDPLNAMIAAYGPDIGREMVAVNYDAPPLRVVGYISRPALTRANRSHQSFFVNRRWVRNRTIGHALDQAYRTLLTVGRHPLAALLLDVPPELVDVNVHPTKAEVRFVRDWEIHQASARAVKDALLAVDLVPHVQVARPSVPEPVQAPLWREDGPLAPMDSRPWPAMPAGTMDSDWTPQSERTGETWTARESGIGSGPSPTCAPLRNARIVGQMHRCYILLETSEGILLVDQHAAHERILYEKFLIRSGKQDVQRLVVPIMLNLGHREAALTTDRLEDFRQLGFEVEPFGPNTFVVRTVPLFARRPDYEQLLRDLVDELAGAEFGRKVGIKREQIAASMACRGAIKQGDVLSMAEMEAVLDGLRGVENPLDIPTNCPHGRPTSILLTLGQVERLFHRT